MNLFTAMTKLFYGSKITHESWKENYYIYYDDGRVFSSNDGEVDILEYIKDASNTGWHLFKVNKTQSALNIKVKDIIQSLTTKYKYVVKCVDDDCVCLFSIGGSQECVVYTKEWWADNRYKNFKIVKE